MKDNKSKFTITYGGWYQRTTIHLTEIYDFLAFGRSDLNLSKSKLKNYRDNLKLKQVTREAGYLEYVKVLTVDGIEIRYYEDGLYTLGLVSSDIRSAKKTLENYYNNYFSPAIKYIFSLGAPTPKILANIRTVHPIVIGIQHDNHSEFKVDTKKFGEVYSKIVSKDITVYKTPEFIFVVSTKSRYKNVQDINEMQIFFREFKDHLEKYLDIHRVIWEEITDIKKQKAIKGSEVAKIRFKLDLYFKTVTLISRRINQMGTYVRTRASIAKTLHIEEYLLDLFTYKFEVLQNTLEYIKEIWAMTREYLDSAIQMIVELQNKSTDVSLKSLRFITTLGVVAGTMGYMSSRRLPEFTYTTIMYFLILLVATWLINKIMTEVYKRIKYKLNFTKDIARFS